jgi:hypothetical protein
VRDAVKFAEFPESSRQITPIPVLQEDRGHPPSAPRAFEVGLQLSMHPIGLHGCIAHEQKQHRAAAHFAEETFEVIPGRQTGVVPKHAVAAVPQQLLDSRGPGLIARRVRGEHV